jgi:branched-chain amino acid transport system permease protein
VPDTETLPDAPAGATTAPTARLLAKETRSRLNLLGTAPARWAAVLTVVAGIGVFASADGKILAVADFGLIAAVAAIGLNLAMGTTGIMSLGHGVFVGFGAFTAAVAMDAGLPFAVGALLGMVVAALASLTIGPLALRLSGLYLAVGTIGIAYVGQHLFVNLRSLTGGGAGRSVESPTVLGVRLADSSAVAGRLVTGDMKWFLLLAAVTAAVASAVAALGRLRWGRAFRAVRDNESSAAAVGINVNRTRVTAFALSAALGGLSGALLAGYLRYLNPETFGLESSIQYIAMIIIGGLGTVSGAVIGAVLIVALPTVLNSVSTALGLVEQASGTSGNFNTGTLALIVYGLVIVAVMTLAPNGVTGGLAHLLDRLRRRPSRRPSSKA